MLVNQQNQVVVGVKQSDPNSVRAPLREILEPRHHGFIKDFKLGNRARLTTCRQKQR